MSTIKKPSVSVAKVSPAKKSEKVKTVKATPVKSAPAKAGIKKASVKEKAPPIKSQEKINVDQEASEKARHFVSTQAMMSFWQDMLNTLQGAVGDESAQKNFQKKLAQLMQDIPKQGFGIPDARLKAPVWQNDPFYAQLSQIYGYQSAVMERMIEALPITDKSSQRKMQFLSRQIIDAFSPANFAWTNPEFINNALQTKGESIMAGLNHMIEDLKKGRITHVDETQFEVGRNVAVTPGKVILRTPLFELLEYAPQTDKVSKRPMLFVPPCINKYYIMDLSPENSLVRFVVEQGHHLYLISWRNIDASTQNIEWDHYIGSVISAINTVREENHGENCNVLGFCVGGTILSTTLAVMAAKNMQLPSSVTLLTTLLDFTEPGDLGVFLSEALLQELEAKVPNGGVVPGSSLAQVFSMLRPKDLVWSYVTQKYLKGEKPKDFDILYWNGDSTNLAVRMIAWYLRNCYWDNALVKKQAIVLGEKIDLSKVSIPAYFYASREDHIVPWASAYDSACYLGSKTELKRFVLGASGHIAGVINPAKTNKRNYWLGVSQSTPNADNADAWMANTKEVAGSWWNDWQAWLANHKGGEVVAKSINYESRKAIDQAPGQYVRRSVDEQTAEVVVNPMTAWMEMWTGLISR